MRPLPILFALFASAAAAWAQEGGAIRTGEHPGFSRIVMSIEPSTEWSLDMAEGSATISFPRRGIAFTTEGVWERIGREHIAGITASRTPEGTAVRLDLACACHVTAALVNARYLAVDVHDRTETPASTAPPAETAASTFSAAVKAAHVLRTRERNANTLETAERVLLEQIERAAEQGLIEFTNQSDKPEPPEETAPDAPAASAVLTPVPRPAQHASSARVDATGLLALTAFNEQIAAVTVFDRDGAERWTVAQQPHPECQADTALDIARWSDGSLISEQIAGFRRRLVGEFDRPDADIIRALARLHIRYGFGAEAGAVLRSFEATVPDHDLLADLARIVDGGEAAGPLAHNIVCPGRHGLWLALAGSPAMLASDGAAPELEAVFAALPLDLRHLLGPRLATNLLEAGRTEVARLILDISLRPGQTPEAPLTLAVARLAAAEGRFAEAETRLASLVERGAHNAADALLALVEIRVAAGGSVPEAWVTDLRALAFEQDGGPKEVPAHALTAEAEARNGDIRAAFTTLAALAADSEAGRAAAEALAPRLLAETDITGTGAAAFAEAVLEHPRLLAPTPEHDAYRLAITAKLLDIGLASPALDILDPMLVRGSEPARAAAARAHLALGEAIAAHTLLDGLAGAEAAALRAKAAARTGDFAAAADAMTVAGTPEAVSAYAWAAGDWERAAASTDPAKAIMARYMRDHDEPAGSLPAVLTPETAFIARPSNLDEPSLGAARTLLEAGPNIRSFIEDLLAAHP